jgi:peptidoglycan/xylan/chitin deacetylase (PgdA/CDA1 family)
MKILCFLIIVSILARQHGPVAITRGDTSKKNLSIVFTGDEFADGGDYIVDMLLKKKVKGSFFLTGNFYRNPQFKGIISSLKQHGHYLGSHSDKHLLYCDWMRRDSLLVTKQEFVADLNDSYDELGKLQITKNDAYYFLPPYEWYNDSIVAWTHEQDLQLINFTPGTRSTADYTYPEMNERYVNSNDIYKSIIEYESQSPNGLNGFILLVHIGTDPRRTDKFYYKLPQLIDVLRKKGYTFVRVDELLSE